MSTPASSYQQHPFETEQTPVSLPIWREALVGLEWMALHLSPVFYGLDVPRGDQSAVIVVPGFLATDHYLFELHAWLQRIGYRPYFSGIGWNVECLNILVERLSRTIAQAQTETGGKVHLIGHSLGGILARAAAALHPESVASVIMLGAPFRGIRSHPLVLGTAELVRAFMLNRPQPDCFTSFCQCPAIASLQHCFPPAIKQTAIFTKSDGVVDWRVCVHDDPASNFEVAATHIGLAFDADTYGVIARRLAEN
jgi:triacylglycerol lipase